MNTFIRRRFDTSISVSLNISAKDVVTGQKNNLIDCIVELVEIFISIEIASLVRKCEKYQFLKMKSVRIGLFGFIRFIRVTVELSKQDVYYSNIFELLLFPKCVFVLNKIEFLLLIGGTNGFGLTLCLEKGNLLTIVYIY